MWKGLLMMFMEVYGKVSIRMVKDMVKGLLQRLMDVSMRES
jgi:hypothetical protein